MTTGRIFLARPALALALVLSACGGGPAVTEESSSPGAPSITVYFTDPATDANRGGPDADLAAAIDAARLTVDAAIYDLNLWSLRDALLAAHRRGVRVRLVAESDNLERAEFQELIQAGIPVLGDRREGLMHHKFVVIDGFQVWTGSMNFTLASAYRSNNNLLHIDSTRLAENYAHEFEEMFTDDLFGSSSARADTPHPLVALDGVDIENYFSPDDGVEARIVELINAARQSVYILAFSFTSDPIGAALQLAQARGLEVAGVLDRDQAGNQGGEYLTLLEAGIDLRLDGIPGDMHHKVIILDEETVITGSFNFSRSAEETNDENVLVIHSAVIAARYIEEFVRVMLVAEE
ncbi:MAG: DUF1669 domain-containing protein [Chloroflexi bacterium]|nr:DUF1669 domain-containing protein [Chloroflexota bacterium]